MSAPKLTPDLEALFEAERESEPLPDGFGESLRARIGRSIGPGGPGGPGGDDSGPGESGPGESGPGESGPSEGGPGDLSSAPGADAGASALQGAAAPVATGLGALQIGSLLGVFGLGLTLGAFGHAAYVGDEATVVVAPPIETSEPLAELVPPPVPARPIEPSPTPSVEVDEVPERVTPTPVRPTPMARLDGRALLDQAQNALARGLAREALAALDDHQRSHRRGPLREERQALRVQALAADGQSLRAQQEAAIFLARYPNSLFRDVVERVTR